MPDKPDPLPNVMDLTPLNPAFNDDPSWTLPMPARYVIRHDGIVLYSEVSPDYTRRSDPAAMFAVLEKAIARV